MDRDDRSGWQANLPPRWINDATYRTLTPEEWWLFSWALAWGVDQENDGTMRHRDLPLIAAPALSRADAEAAAAGLVAAGLWNLTDDGYHVVDWSASQVTAAEIQQKREGWKRKKAGQRQPRVSVVPSVPVLPSVLVVPDPPGDASGDSPGGSPGDRGVGEASKFEEPRFEPYLDEHGRRKMRRVRS